MAKCPVGVAKYPVGVAINPVGVTKCSVGGAMDPVGGVASSPRMTSSRRGPLGTLQFTGNFLFKTSRFILSDSECLLFEKSGLKSVTFVFDGDHMSLFPLFRPWWFNNFFALERK